MPLPLKKKIKAYRFGLWAETAAVLYYASRGYLPVARRYKTKLGEIDLIVASGKQIIFVEVKARKKHDPIFPLHPMQLQRIQRAALLFVAKTPRFASVQQSVDLLLIKPWSWPQRLTNISI